MRRTPLFASSRVLRLSTGATWLVGAALFAHLAAAWLSVSAQPASKSISAVSLVDDRGGAALFTSAPMRPGRTETACVGLTVTGSAQSFSEVTLSAELTEHGVAPYLFLAVERGALADPARCSSFTGVPVWSGTLAELARTSPAGVPTGWRPGDPTSMAYRVSATLLDDSRAQGRRAAGTFVWALDAEPFPPTPLADAGTPRAAAPVPMGTPSAVPPSPPSEAPVATPPSTEPDGDPPRAARGGDVVQASPLQASPTTVAQVVSAVGETALAVVEDGQFPVALVAVAAGFLGVQGRLDRRDPKLALAPVHQDLNDFQDFPPTPRTAPT